MLSLGTNEWDDGKEPARAPARNDESGKSDEKSFHIEMVDTWASFGLKGKLGKLRAKTSGSSRQAPSGKFPERLQDVQVSENGVNSLKDTTFASAQQVYAAKIRQTSDASVVEEYDRMREEAAVNRVSRKNKITRRPAPAPQKRDGRGSAGFNIAAMARRKKKKRRKKRKPSSDASTPATAAPDAEEEEEDPVVSPQSRNNAQHHPKRVPVATEGILMGLPVESLEDYRHSDDQMELYTHAVTRMGRATEDMILAMPPVNEVLSFCRQFQNKECLWFYSINNLISDADTCLDYPDVCVLSRKYLETFMREPDPRQPYERPCINLDRAPLPGEGKIQCVGHALSEKLLGPGKGYRLRELILRDQMTQVNAALAHNEAVRANGGHGTLLQPRDWLDPIPELCVMCHIYFTNMDYIRQKDKEVERERKVQQKAALYEQGGEDLNLDMDVDSGTGANTSIVIANKFMVIPNRAGEYPLSMTLTGDKAPTGVWGPFPVWNNQNYVPVKISGTELRGFKETDNLVFREPQQSQQIGSLLRHPSSRSTPTPYTQRALSSPQ